MTFPQTPGVDEGRIERQRKTLYWLEGGLRLVNRAFYVGEFVFVLWGSSWVHWYSYLLG
jgi:hypothetical protein